MLRLKKWISPIGCFTFPMLSISDAHTRTLRPGVRPQTTDGRCPSMSKISDALVVQHYVAEIHEPHLCRMVSMSDSVSPAGRTKLQVVWELSVKKIDAQSCEYTNHVHSIAIDQTLAFLKEHNIPFETARDARQQASHAHNQEETPKFAKSI